MGYSIAGSTEAGVGILRAMLRASGSVTTAEIGQILLTAVVSGSPTTVRNVSLTSANWNAPSGGVVSLITPLLLSNFSSPTATINAGLPFTVGSTGWGAASLVVGLSTDAVADIVLDDVNAAAASNHITDFRIRIDASNGTVMFSTTLRNRILDLITQRNTALFSGAGTIKIYTGTPPADADTAATGTQLISFTTSTTTWNDPSTGTASLASTLTTTASATGTAGYARFSWTDSGSNTYTIQGSIGTTGTDFIVDNTSMTSGSTYNLTAATMVFP